MKTEYVVAGLAGLLMIGVNLAGLPGRDNAVLGANCNASQSSNNISIDGCNHDCYGCGKCFSEQGAATYRQASAVLSKFPYNLIVEKEINYE